MELSKQPIVCIVLLLCALVHRASGSCILKVSSESQPILTRKLGSKAILLETSEQIYLEEGDEVQAYCSSGFQSLNVKDRYGHLSAYLYNTEHNLHFECFSHDVVVSNRHKTGHRRYGIENDDDDDDDDNDNPTDTSPRRKLYENTIIQCVGSSYAIFESKHELANCDALSSYALGAKLHKPLIIAGVCYDLANLKLKYVSYKLQEPPALLDVAEKFYPVGLNSSSLAEPLKSIKHVFKFPSANLVAESILSQAETNFWLRVAHFELGNIVQTQSHYKQQFEENDSLFNIVWWQHLRVGNWRRFVELLEKRSKTVNYNVFTGTSGELRVPMEQQKCETEISAPLEFPGVEVTVPQFIWTYLQSTTEGIREEFVVIAYNSPYIEYFERNSTVLCDDMCDDIAWLKPMNDSRHISALGKFYCCRSEEVAELLDGFPVALSNAAKITEKTTATP